jgi:hypothetical protein
LTRSLQPSDTPIESITLEEFFAPVVTDQEWFDDEDRAIAQRFRDLQAAIATLEEICQDCNLYETGFRYL